MVFGTPSSEYYTMNCDKRKLLLPIVCKPMNDPPILLNESYKIERFLSWVQIDFCKTTRNDTKRRLQSNLPDGVFCVNTSEAPIKAVSWSLSKKRRTPVLYQYQSPYVVGVTGFEPMASWSRTKHATNCATPRSALLLYRTKMRLSSVNNCAFQIKMPYRLA